VHDGGIAAVDLEFGELDLEAGNSRRRPPSKTVVGRISGEIAGGPSCVPASIALR